MDKLKQMEERIDALLTDDMLVTLKDVRGEHAEVFLKIGTIQAKTAIAYDVDDKKVKSTINRTISRIYERHIYASKQFDNLNISVAYLTHEAVVGVRDSKTERVILKVKVGEFSLACIEPLIELIDRSNI